MSKYNSYCTFDDLVDIYPNIDEYDTKSPIYNFEEFDIPANYPLPDDDEMRTYYISYNTGHIKSLFINGKDQGSNAVSPSFINEELNTWHYNSQDDTLLVLTGENLNEAVVEKGDNWSNLKNKIINKASRYT